MDVTIKTMGDEIIQKIQNFLPTHTQTCPNTAGIKYRNDTLKRL
jgi:hypothetical protein